MIFGLKGHLMKGKIEKRDENRSAIFCAKYT